MAAEAEDDLFFIKASSGLLSDLEDALPNLLWKHGRRPHAHQLVRQRDLQYVIQLIEPFQGEPHLLDSRLKSTLPPIIDAYLAFLQSKSRKTPTSGTVCLDVALSRILYTFCKVRGDKVVIGFFNNEPKYLELILSCLENIDSITTEDGTSWQSSYILLLWLVHLLLTPFDLASISTTPALSENNDLNLSIQAPPLASRIIAVGAKYLVSATRAQDAAAKLLVRLATRPDMQLLGLPSALVSWASSKLVSPVSETSCELHDYIGPLRFIAGMTASPDPVEASKFLPIIYGTTKNVVENPLFAFLYSSAVTRKLVIKVFRNISLLSINHAFEESLVSLGGIGVLEDTIDHLLQSLADRDTPVRFAASKALSIIVQRLDTDTAQDVIQAVLDIMHGDMPREGSTMDYRTANPLRWHGLTLTLAHALFRRSASPTYLPDILKALLAALNFEQRSMTGASSGTNVRDAACFGIWSLSRRYTTAELLSVDLQALQSSKKSQPFHSVIRLMALELVLAACLDPAGNIRRGSSAALQELVGRHPDQVPQGIDLIQIIDYHAIGLRQRAMTEVAFAVSCLATYDKTILLKSLIEWRGLGSPDIASREAAARTVGRLCISEPYTFFQSTMSAMAVRCSASSTSNLEDFQGALLAMTEIMNCTAFPKDSSANDQKRDCLTHFLHCVEILGRSDLVSLLQILPAIRADLPTAIVRFITSISDICRVNNTADVPDTIKNGRLNQVVTVLLSRSEETTLQVVPSMIKSLLLLHATREEVPCAIELSELLERVVSDATAQSAHGAGRAIAIGAAYGCLPSLARYTPADLVTICSRLCKLVSTAPSTEWRVFILRALEQLTGAAPLDSRIADVIKEALVIGLNDYTITERGDVGSLVRMRAIQCVGKAWRLGVFDKTRSQLYCNIRRLSLEKLDRIRVEAARCMIYCHMHNQALSDTRLKPAIEDLSLEGPSTINVVDVSSVDYFVQALGILQDPQFSDAERIALLKGCVSCAGGGSEVLMQAARAALVQVIHGSSPPESALVLSTLAAILKQYTLEGIDQQALLELLAFLLDVLPQFQEPEISMNWRSLLALVQKAHFKSTNVAKIIAAIEVYQQLASISAIRGEVLKKLTSMLNTNPYPKVRSAVADCLFLVTKDENIKTINSSQRGTNFSLQESVFQSRQSSAT